MTSFDALPSFGEERVDSELRRRRCPGEEHTWRKAPKVRLRRRERGIRPPEHLPMTTHWNFVAQNLSGDWFSLLSSDDVAEPRFVEHLSRAMTSDLDAVLVRGGWLSISPAGRAIGRHRLLATSTVTRPPRTFLEQFEGPKTSFAAFLCRRSAWLEVGGFPPSLHMYGDWGLWMRLSAVGTFVTMHRIAARYQTAYPDSRIADRIVDGAHDERVIALEAAVGAANTLGLSSQGVMRLAARRRLTAYLAQAADVVADATTRGRVADEPNSIADMVDQGRIVDGFWAGKPVQALARPGVVRLSAAAVGARFHALTDRGSRSVR